MSLVLDEVPDLVGDAGGVAGVLDVIVATSARHRPPGNFEFEIGQLKKSDILGYSDKRGSMDIHPVIFLKNTFIRVSQ